MLLGKRRPCGLGNSCCSFKRGGAEEDGNRARATDKNEDAAKCLNGSRAWSEIGTVRYKNTGCLPTRGIDNL